MKHLVLIPHAFFAKWVLIGIPVILFLGILSSTAAAQSASDFAVHVQVRHTASGDLSISWNTVANATAYTVYRKSPESGSWGTALASLTGSDTAYLDEDVEDGQTYEYRVVKNTASYGAYGYATAATNGRLPGGPRDVILVVESGIAAALTAEIDDLVNDLQGDGYGVERIEVSADTTPAYVKTLIKEAYDNLPNPRTLYLLGHVPVPYSGNINPDAHPDHLGAWPADLYYGEFDDTWTDGTINNVTASDTRNHNVPGDGKFDRSILGGDMELEVGRVDFANLGLFSESEIELTRRYLNRVHAYKNGLWTLPERALIDDNFGGFSGEAFAASAWRSFSPLIGRDNILAADYRSTMATQGYLFSYGCGGGSHTSASGIGTSTDLAGDSLQTGFTMLFGSYFGDWDRPNNLMRAALAQGTTMSISWAGRPHWFYHPMAQGFSLGYCAKMAMENNSSVYSNQVNYAARWVHIALLGDPSLRMKYPAPASEVIVDTVDTYHVRVRWTASQEADLDGYHVYQSVEGSPWFQRTTTPVTDTVFVDSCVVLKGHYRYMVRSVRHERLASGSLWNESLGAFGEVEIHTSKLPSAQISYLPTGQTLPPFCTIVFTAAPGMWTNEPIWLFDDTTLIGNTVSYTTDKGSWIPYPYRVVLENECVSDTLDEEYVWYYWGIGEHKAARWRIYPNPNDGNLLFVESDQPVEHAELLALDGRKLIQWTRPGRQLELPDLPAGVYLMRVAIEGETELSTQRLILE